MNVCRGCQARIRWVITVAGEFMPLNAEPDPDGNIVLTGRTRKSRAGTTVPECRVVAQDGLFEVEGERFRSHFADCPKADEFRKAST